MEDIKRFIKIIKEDKRKRAIVSLCGWAVFLLIVFILMGGVNTVPSSINPASGDNKNKAINKGNALDNYANMSNFEYSYLIETTYNGVDNTYKINGTYYNDINYFEFDSEKYMIKDDVVYLIDSENNKLINITSIKGNKLNDLMDIRLLNKNNFGTFLKSSEETTKTSYKDGGSQRTLIYKSSDGKSITFVTSEYSNLINSVDVDFKKYFTNYTSFKVSIALKNINNIDKYDANYDGYKVVEKGE